MTARGPEHLLRTPQTIDKPIFPVWGCMKGPQPLHIFAPASAFAGPGFRFANNVCEPPAAQSAAFEIRRTGFAVQGWKPFGLPSRLRRPRTAKSKILTPRRWSGPSGRFLYHFSSRPGPRFTCPGFRPCGALKRCPRTSSRVNAASDRPSPKVTKGGRASARLATAN